jgi:hypothetical protein
LQSGEKYAEASEACLEGEIEAGLFDELKESVFGVSDASVSAIAVAIEGTDPESEPAIGGADVNDTAGLEALGEFSEDVEVVVEVLDDFEEEDLVEFFGQLVDFFSGHGLECKAIGRTAEVRLKGLAASDLLGIETDGEDRAAFAAGAGSEEAVAAAKVEGACFGFVEEVFNDFPTGAQPEVKPGIEESFKEHLQRHSYLLAYIGTSREGGAMGAVVL